MKCPNCSVNLLMSERQGIEIDYCPECRGVWLDKGELDKFIQQANNRYPEEQSSRDHTRQRSENQYSDDDDEYRGRQPRRKRDSFLSEIFDF